MGTAWFRWCVNVSLNVCVPALHWLWQEDDLKQEEDDMRSERESVQGEKAKTVLDVLRSRCVRWQLLALAIPCAGVQFCGNNAVSHYGYYGEQFVHFCC